MTNGMRKMQDETDPGKNHLAYILQGLGEGVIVSDRSMNVVLMNVKAMEYLDYIPSSGDPVKLDGLFRYCVSGADAVMAMIDAGSEDETEEEIVIRGPHGKDRSLRVKKNSLAELMPDSPETILLLQDITRERELDRLKKEFISNLSHELRTPMNAIMGISKMLKNKNASNLSETQAQGLEMIYESGARLLSLINDLLDLSKIEAGKVEIQRHPFRIEAMIRYLEEVSSSLMTSGLVRFRCEVDASVPAVIFSDEDRIHQVLVNLIGNSFKFTEKGEIVLAMKYEEGRLLFSVSDTGIGISEKDLPHVFERFKQADGSMSRRFQGTGLGLALCREMVGLLGGEIQAASVEGRGTTMSFYIPYSPGDIPPGGVGDNVLAGGDYHPEQVPVPDPEKQGVVLILEDEETGRETLRLILEDEFKLYFAENGNNVSEQLQKYKPDIVLMDLMMPGVDGYQALNIIRGEEGGRHVPVIAVTARAMKGEKERILNYGFNGYISKPVDDEELLETIYMALESKNDSSI